MTKAERGFRGNRYDSYGIIGGMTEDGRRALAIAVRRHREYRGWSRPKMAAEAARGIDGPPPVSASTIQNVEDPNSQSEVTGKTKAGIERAFGWRTDTVSAILSGRPAPEVGDEPDEMSPVEEDRRAWSTIKAWPKDVQDAATFFGSLLAVHPDPEKRQQLADEAFRVLLRAQL